MSVAGQADALVYSDNVLADPGDWERVSVPDHLGTLTTSTIEQFCCKKDYFKGAEVCWLRTLQEDNGLFCSEFGSGSEFCSAIYIYLK